MRAQTQLRCHVLARCTTTRKKPTPTSFTSCALRFTFSILERCFQRGYQSRYRVLGGFDLDGQAKLAHGLARDRTDGRYRDSPEKLSRLTPEQTDQMADRRRAGEGDDVHFFFVEQSARDLRVAV